jgi:hypothetical protein
VVPGEWHALQLAEGSKVLFHHSCASGWLFVSKNPYAGAVHATMQTTSVARTICGFIVSRCPRIA